MTDSSTDCLSSPAQSGFQVDGAACHGEHPEPQGNSGGCTVSRKHLSVSTPAEN